MLLPGDLINNSLSDLSDALDAVSNMQSRHGTYLCVGNHDLIENGVEFVRRVKARLPLLVDESRIISIGGHRVQLLGLRWVREEYWIDDSVRRLGRQIAPRVPHSPSSPPARLRRRGRGGYTADRLRAYPRRPAHAHGIGGFWATDVSLLVGPLSKARA